MNIFTHRLVKNLKELAATGSISARKYEKFVKDKTDETKKMLDAYIQSEYKDLLKLEKGSEGDRTTLMEEAKEFFSTEKAAYGKYILGRLNVKRMNKEMHKAIDITKEIENMFRGLKGGEPTPAWIKAFDKSINNFYDKIQGAVKNSYKAMKRLFLLRYYELEELKKLKILDEELSEKVIIPQVLRNYFVKRINEIEVKTHGDIKTEMEVLRREESIL